MSSSRKVICLMVLIITQMKKTYALSLYTAYVTSTSGPAWETTESENGVTPFMNSSLKSVINAKVTSNHVTGLLQNGTSNLAPTSDLPTHYFNSLNSIENISGSYLNQSVENTTAALLPLPDEEAPVWSKVLDISQLVLTIVGVIANVATVITLGKNGKAFSRIILILFRHQSTVDAIACAMAAVQLGVPGYWLTGVPFLDQIVCHGWHSLMIYSAFICISIYNLVAIAFERYLTVCHPFRRQRLTESTIRKIIIVMYVFSFLALTPALFQIKLEGGVCLPEPQYDTKIAHDILFGFSVNLFITVWALPSLVFIIFYGSIICTFQRRQQKQNFASSRVVEKATTELTKTAIIVTVIFMIAIGFDLWNYLLGRTGIIPYKLNSLEQRLAVWFLAFNSVANPFVYAMLMPAYRRSVQMTFFPCCVAPEIGNKEKDSSNSSSTKTVQSVARDNVY